MAESSVSASGVVPVFPLPSAVLFPHTVLALHVFEPRYREMVRHARSGEGLIALALLRPGFEKDYAGSPAIHRVATIGELRDVERLPDGRFNLNLVGLERVTLSELPSQHTYRIARVEPRDETEVDDDDPTIRSAKLDLLATQGYLMRELTGGTGPGLAVDDRVPFATAVNGACANLPAEPGVRQELLEIDDVMRRHGRVVELLHETLGRVLQLRGAASDDDDDTPQGWVN